MSIMKLNQQLVFSVRIHKLYGKMQSYLMLQYVVHIVTAGL